MTPIQLTVTLKLILLCYTTGFQCFAKHGIPFKHEPLCAVGISVFVTCRPGKCFYIVVVVFIFAVDLELGCQIRAKKGSLFGGIISIIIITMLNEFVLARKTKTARSKYQLKARLSQQN